MNHYRILIWLFTASLFSCNNSTQSSAAIKKDSVVVKKDSPVVLSKDSITMSISHPVKLPDGETLENMIIDTIMKLPGIIERDQYIRKKTKGDRHLSIMVEPADDKSFRWVRAGEDNGFNWVTHFSFVVYPETMTIMYYDVAEDKKISLEEWTKLKNK